MKAWERELEIINNAVPVYDDDASGNEQIWEEQQTGPEEAEDGLCFIHWHSQVPGSRAHESICTASIQATENKGYIVDGGMDLIMEGLKIREGENPDMVKLLQLEQEVYNACYKARKDESSPYWKQKFYDSFEEYEKAVNFKEKKEVNGDEFDKTYAGWLSQIIGGAYGTCIEGYTADAIKKKYNGEVRKYVRKPNTYNDDITYELALLLAYDRKGKETTAKDIALEWVSRIPSGWSAEEWALRNLKAGILPPESGRFNNPFNEWIGAQMRGAICGQLYPGNLKEAARCAFMDASISHDRNGILGEVFNAMMVSLGYVENDVKKILTTCIDLIPEDSEYGSVIRFAYNECLKHDNYYDAWKVCEAKYNHYNWIHAYPNACAEVVALYYGNGEFEDTLAICGGCGQDVDCNAAQVMTILGVINGSDFIPEYWKAPIGDELITYVRGIKKMSIKGLAKQTVEVANKLK